MEYIRANELYHITQSIYCRSNKLIKGISSDNHTKRNTLNSGRNHAIYFKRHLREERPYGELLEVFAKEIKKTLQQKAHIRRAENRSKSGQYIHAKYYDIENTISKGEKRRVGEGVRGGKGEGGGKEGGEKLGKRKKREGVR